MYRHGYSTLCVTHIVWRSDFRQILFPSNLFRDGRTSLFQQRRQLSRHALQLDATLPFRRWMQAGGFNALPAKNCAAEGSRRSSRFQ